MEDSTISFIKTMAVVFIVGLATGLSFHHFEPNPGPPYQGYQWPEYEYKIMEDEPNLIGVGGDFWIWKVNETSNLTIKIPFVIKRIGGDNRSWATYVKVFYVGNYTNRSSNYTGDIVAKEDESYKINITLESHTLNTVTFIRTTAPGNYYGDITITLNNETLSQMGYYHAVVMDFEFYTDCTGLRSMPPPPGEAFQRNITIWVEKVPELP